MTTQELLTSWINFTGLELQRYTEDGLIEQLDLMVINPSLLTINTISKILAQKDGHFEKCYYSSTYLNLSVTGPLPNGLFEDITNFQILEFRDRKLAMIVEVNPGGRIFNQTPEGITPKRFLSQQVVKSLAAKGCMIGSQFKQQMDFWKIAALWCQGITLDIFEATQWNLFHQSLKPKPQILSLELNFGWNEAYFSHLKSILIFFMDSSQVELFLSEKYKPDWIRAVKHQTIDYDDNYEIFEWYGDGISKFLLQEFIFRKLKEHKENKKALTEYKNQYQSSKFQAMIARDLRLDDWILCQGFDLKQDIYSDSNVRRTIKILSDLFEAFVGCLTYVGNDIKQNLGFTVGLDFVSKFAESFSFEPDMTYGLPKTQIIQIGERLNLRGDKFLTIKNGKSKDGENFRSIEIKPSTEFLEVLHKSEKFVTEEQLRIFLKVNYRKYDDILLQDEAYELLLEKFNNCHIDQEFVVNWKNSNLNRGLLRFSLNQEELDQIRRKGYAPEDLDIFIPPLLSILGIRMISSNKILTIVDYHLSDNCKENLKKTINAALDKIAQNL